MFTDLTEVILVYIKKSTETVLAERFVIPSSEVGKWPCSSWIKSNIQWSNSIEQSRMHCDRCNKEKKHKQ